MKVEAEDFPTACSSDSDLLQARSSFARRRGKRFGSPDTGSCGRQAKTVVARGKFEGFRVRVEDRGELSLTVNGKKEPAVVRDGFLVYGDVPGEAEAAAPRPRRQRKPPETRASVHSYFLPEEVRLKAGAEREVAMTLRAVGRGEAAGALRFVAPEGISVEPETVELAPPLAEGATRTVTLRIKARAGLPNGLFEVRSEPVGETPAATEILPVSVGVVLKKDRRVPRLAQWVARAPGYTMKVDEFSGVGTYLLDADGHRRFGRFATGNFIYGFGAVQRGKRLDLPRAAGLPAGLELAGLAHLPQRRPAPLRVPRGSDRHQISQSLARKSGANRLAGELRRAGSPRPQRHPARPARAGRGRMALLPAPRLPPGRAPPLLEENAGDRVPSVDPDRRQRAIGRPLSDAVGGRGVAELHDERGTAPMKAAAPDCAFLGRTM